MPGKAVTGVLRLLRLGYFGKAPVTGDFLARNIDRDVRDALDSWLQQSLEASRKALGDSWLHSFLTAPIWRFVVTGLGQRGPIVGLLMPSVDKVGRYFPLALVAEISATGIDARLLMACDQLLTRLEPLLLTALEDDFDVDYFSHQLDAVAKQIAARPDQDAEDSPGIAKITDLAGLDATLRQQDWRNASVWWTDGSDYRKAEMIIHQKLPRPAAFATLLRDADIFADFERDWNNIRHLGLMQNDNGQIELGRPAAPWPFHAICHPGKMQDHNAGYAELSADGSMLTLSDGRFGVKSHAMTSRLVCRSLPQIWRNEEAVIPLEDVERLVGFLSARKPSQSSNLMPMLSFAAIAYDSEQSLFHLAVAGDYFCLLHDGSSLTKLFAHDQVEGTLAPTVRRPAGALYKMVSLRLNPGASLIVGSSIFSDKALLPHLVEALRHEDPAAIARGLIQEPLIRGLGGNLALAVVQTRAEVQS